MRFVLVAALVAAGALSDCRAESVADRWNLAELYASQAAWDADAKTLQAQFDELAACKGHLGDSAARLRQCLDLRTDMAKRRARLFMFAREQLAEDTGAPASLTLQQRAERLDHQLTEATAFVEP